jgi:hypothetical protein
MFCGERRVPFATLPVRARIEVRRTKFLLVSGACSLDAILQLVLSEALT